VGATDTKAPKKTSPRRSRGRPTVAITRVEYGSALISTFDYLDDVYVFVKDADRRFVACSAPFARLLGYRHTSQIIGLRDEDLSPEYLADHYRSDDEYILQSGERIVDLVELVRNPDGAYDWYLTTKAPVLASDGVPTGIVGHTRSLTRRNMKAASLLSLTPALELISRDYGRTISVAEMAAAVPMSPSSFTRTFRRHFGCTPHQYLRNVRIAAACDLLSMTDLPLTDIAEHAGFYDQSHFARDFKSSRGMTASAYRRRFGGALASLIGSRLSLANSLDGTPHRSRIGSTS
jgi:PAS domain S-box-containing protein